MNFQLEIKTDPVSFNGEVFESKDNPQLAILLNTIWKSDMFIEAGPPSLDPYRERVQLICDFLGGKIISYTPDKMEKIIDDSNIIR